MPPAGNQQRISLYLKDILHTLSFRKLTLDPKTTCPLLYTHSGAERIPGCLWAKLKQRKARLVFRCGVGGTAVWSPGPTELTRACREKGGEFTVFEHKANSTQVPAPKVRAWFGIGTQVWEGIRKKKPRFSQKGNQYQEGLGLWPKKEWDNVDSQHASPVSGTCLCASFSFPGTRAPLAGAFNRQHL